MISLLLMSASIHLDDDQIERQSNAVRSAASELLNVSIYSLQEAFDSQEKIRKKISLLDDLLKSVVNMPDVPNYEEGVQNLDRLKLRVDELKTRIQLLNTRITDLEKVIPH